MRGVCVSSKFSIAIFSLALTAFAQQAPPPPTGPGNDHAPYGDGPGMHHQGPPPGDHLLRGGSPGKWWNDPGVVVRLGITPDQQKRTEALFQQNRLHLIDLTAALEKENAILDPLLQAERPDEPRILAQIDRIAQARAELEKANARFLLGIRAILTPEQWRKLAAEQPGPPPDHHHGAMPPSPPSDRFEH